MNELEQKLSDAKSDVTDLIIDQLSGKKNIYKTTNQPTNKIELKNPCFKPSLFICNHNLKPL